MNALQLVLLAAALCFVELCFTLAAHDAPIGEKIIKCKKAEKNTLQFMVSVQVEEKHRCGGFLIDPSFVLTAAHCFKEKMSVVIGTHDINKATQNPSHYRHAVKGNHTHKSYKHPADGYDIMLLELFDKVHQSDDVKIVQLSKQDEKVKVHRQCQVAGWGQTERTKKSVPDLMETNVSVISYKTCNDKWGQVGKTLPQGVMCAGGTEESGACQGDSGGPLVCDGVAVGIVSFNFNCNCKYPNVPNVYTNIAEYRTWIDGIVDKGV